MGNCFVSRINAKCEFFATCITKYEHIFLKASENCNKLYYITYVILRIGKMSQENLLGRQKYVLPHLFNHRPFRHIYVTYTGPVLSKFQQFLKDKF